MACGCLDAAAGSWMYSGADAKLSVDLDEDGRCVVFGQLKRNSGRVTSAQCIFRVEGPRVSLIWTGPGAERGLAPLDLVLSSDARVMRIEGELERVLRSTRAAAMTTVQGKRGLSEWELRARWESFFLCEGVHVEDMRLSPRETRLEIEIASPEAWKGSKVYVDAGNGAECGRPLDLEPG